MCDNKKDVSLPPISGAARLKRESGENPEQFPLLLALHAGLYATENLVFREGGQNKGVSQKTCRLSLKRSFRDKSWLSLIIKGVPSVSASILM